MASREAGGTGAKVRCAIYTRKSSDEGLEQEFNSLDAQYEACAAYVMSQRQEGWDLVKVRYDDGGFSGGTMERPGLKSLPADVASGKVQVIVLYKIDRLTRSLADFSRIVDVLEAGASFVSVTQSFNTTTSMGRLMLNVLLSFAQFEREVTGERIRDKIVASKAKGMWMGGCPAPNHRCGRICCGPPPEPSPVKGVQSIGSRTWPGHQYSICPIVVNRSRVYVFRSIRQTVMSVSSPQR